MVTEVFTMQYPFEQYFTIEELEHAYLVAAPNIKVEVGKNLGVDVSKLSEHYFHDYWRRKCHTHWLAEGDWMFLWRRSGREPIKWPTNKEAFLNCVKIHLNGCLLYSYDNCDLIEKTHKKYTSICEKCLIPIQGCESERYCARCYRSVLNKWRP